MPGGLIRLAQIAAAIVGLKLSSPVCMRCCALRYA